MFFLQLLGGAALVGPDGPLAGPASHRHRLGLLALLSLSHPRALSRDKLMALLWPESDAEHARSLLNLAVHVVRRALGEDALTPVGDGLVLNLSRLSSDVSDFEAAVARGDQESAVELYGGPLLDGFFLTGAPEFDRWVERERERLARQFSAALEGLAEARTAEGDYQRAVDAWLRLAWAEPFNSRIALRMVQALEAAGDRAGALRHARQHAQFLSEEFGAQPDAELIAYTESLRRTPARTPASPAPGVLETVEARLGPSGHPRVSRPNTNPESYNLYLKGRYAWNRRTRESLAQSIDFLRQSVLLSPDHARAWAALADTYAISGFYDYLPPGEAFPPAREAALRAAQLDPSLAQPRVMLGYIALYYDWDLEAAEAHFRAAIERDPTYPVAHQWYGNLLTAAGRFDEAVSEMRRATELDPLSIIASSAVGWVYYHAGEFEKCVEALRTTLQLDGAFVPAHLRLGLALDQMGDRRQALEALERAAALSPNEPGIIAALAYVRARAGLTAEAEVLLNGVITPGGYLPSYEIAKAYLALGHRDHALEWLERARDERSHSMVLAGVDPQLTELRDSPRFHQLTRSLAEGPPSNPAVAPTVSPHFLSAARPATAAPAGSGARKRVARVAAVLAGMGLLLVSILFVSRWRAGEGRGITNGNESSALGGTFDVESNNLYQKGRYAWNRRTREGLEQAVTYFKQAIARSPEYARAHAGLADAYAVLGFYDYRRPAEAFEAARQAAREALRLEPRLGEPHATLGYVHLYYDWKLSEGEAEFREAIRINPDYSVAHQWYGNLLTASGRFDEAVQEMQRAQAIDPQSIIAGAALGWVYYYAAREDSAIIQFYRTLELDQNFSLAHQWLGLTYLETGQSSEGVRNLQRALSLSPASTQTAAALAYGFARDGQQDSARSLLNNLLARDEYLPSFEIAKVYLALGDTTAAFEWLDRARQQRSHSTVFLKVDPPLKALRSDPRFRQLLSSAGL